jgi:hypothetical protein
LALSGIQVAVFLEQALHDGRDVVRGAMADLAIHFGLRLGEHGGIVEGQAAGCAIHRDDRAEQKVEAATASVPAWRWRAGCCSLN